ncbi:MAG: hypothetical protein PHX13_06720 [Thiovulaceae bacterium]|nr:hypothetical protein [Sulfurimonadaceae bacterium]
MSKDIQQIDGISTAFGVSAVITLILNTLLAIAKDLYPPLQKMMASLSTHHWITHAIFDIVIFFALGYFIYLTKSTKTINSDQLVRWLYSSIFVSVSGLVGWFFFV